MGRGEGGSLQEGNEKVFWRVEEARRGVVPSKSRGEGFVLGEGNCKKVEAVRGSRDEGALLQLRW